jgi:2-(1,2-epoxy-1,2-dihydrophenyl)acetyl-CoA isomerase
MNFEGIGFDVVNGVAHITLKYSPRTPNDLKTSQELLRAARLCDEHPGVRAVLIATEGETPSVGGDLKEFSNAGEELPLLLKELDTNLHAVLWRLVRLRAPVVCAVGGTVAVEDLCLVLASDIVLASESASFHYRYSRTGLSLDDSSTYLLQHIMGMRQARRFALLGRPLSAEEALEWGLITRVVEDPELVEEATRLVSELATGPTEAFAATKRLFYQSWTESLETQMELERRALTDIASTSDAMEGIRAFLEKRPAEFQGE